MTRRDDRNGGLPRLSDSVAHAARSLPKTLAGRPYESLSPLLGIRPAKYVVYLR